MILCCTLRFRSIYIYYKIINGHKTTVIEQYDNIFLISIVVFDIKCFSAAREERVNFCVWGGGGVFK